MLKMGKEERRRGASGQGGTFEEDKSDPVVEEGLPEQEEVEGPVRLHLQQYTLYTVHYTIYTLHCTLHTKHSTLNAVPCKFHNI